MNNIGICGAYLTKALILKLHGNRVTEANSLGTCLYIYIQGILCGGAYENTYLKAP